MTPSSLKLIGSIALGNALVPLNSTMLVVALPAIARDADVDLAWWMSSSGTRSQSAAVSVIVLGGGVSCWAHSSTSE